MDIDIRVISFAPRVFKFIRALDNIDEIDIMRSVKPSMNKMQIFKTNKNQSHSSGGKSGSFFFFTQDKQFIIKTMTKKEKEILMKLLPNQVRYLLETGGKSLISRVYGIYKVKCQGMKSIYLFL